MKTTCKLALLALFFIALPAAYAGPKLKIHTDLDKAKTLAKKEGKPVFLEFMSSTCGHCQAFKKNILSDPEFITYANEKLVVVIHDYQALSGLPADEKKERQALMKQLKVSGFPTILLIDPSGKILLRKSGYSGAPAEKILNSLKKASKS